MRKIIFALLIIIFSVIPVSLTNSPWALAYAKTKSKLQKAIELSAGYLIRTCDENGKFLYRINLNPNVTPKPKYNMLRHAGTIYALAMYEQRYPDKNTRNAISRAGQFLKKKAVAPILGRDDLLAVWSYPEITGRKGPAQAKLGGTGLGLVALLSIEKTEPGTTPVDYLRKMGQFLIFMQKKDGSFHSKYIPAKGGKNDKWVSLYYPGEAVLGLLMLYEKDPSPQWLDVATKGIEYLARVRKGKTVVEADHWALIATARMLPLYSLSGQAYPGKAILQHAVQICESILAQKAEHPTTSGKYGCFTNDGRTCPTATRLEGLLASLTFLPPENKELHKHIKSSVRQGINFLLRSQINFGKYAGGFTRAVGQLPADHPGHSKSFNKRSTEVRIDYVQHALSAMIQFQKNGGVP
ncbi:MAG: hypothetical protein GY795_30970 [Desulfobacterales bacterium]|nr:hypothetical protein [Desulfobacterales bacterium]